MFLRLDAVPCVLPVLGASMLPDLGGSFLSKIKVRVLQTHVV
jgi:hypothetical protein